MALCFLKLGDPSSLKGKLLRRCVLHKIQTTIQLALLGIASALHVQPALAQEPTFQLSGVRFNESVYLTDADLQSAIAPYMNRPLVFEEVSAMMQAVEALYAQAGVVTASVVLQPQEVNDGGVLRLTLIEARTESVAYKGRSDYQEQLLGYVFPSEVDAFPDYDAIGEQLRFFQIAYGVLPRIEFAPGQAPATTVQTVEIDVAPRANWRVALDNYASDSEDRLQFTVAREYFDFSGRLDSLSLSASATAGGFKLNGNYRIPVGPYGGTFSASGAFSQTETVAGAFAASGLESAASEFSVAYSQPFRVTDIGLYQFQVGLNASNTKSTIAGIDLQDSTLVDLDARVTIARSFEGAAISADAGFRLGTAESASASGTDGDFALAFANGAYDRELGDRFSLRLTGRAQLAPDENLPSGQRFSVGGLSGLVGYPDDVRTGDSGISGRLQVSCRAPCLSERFATYRPEIYAFADVGWIETFRGDDASVEEEPWLYSVGVGGTFEIRDVFVTTSLGVPLVETTGFEDVGEPRFYAGISYDF